jgi:hypothetical protein
MRVVHLALRIEKWIPNSHVLAKSEKFRLVPNRLTVRELTAGLRALASGKLRPHLAAAANPLPRKGRPKLHLED